MPDTPPILRLTTAGGDSWDDPSEDALFEFMTDLDGHNPWLEVARLDDPGAGDSCRLLLQPSGCFELALREGSTRRTAEELDFRFAHEALTGWAFRLPEWDAGVRWGA